MCVYIYIEPFSPSFSIFRKQCLHHQLPLQTHLLYSSPPRTPPPPRCRAAAACRVKLPRPLLPPKRMIITSCFQWVVVAMQAVKKSRRLIEPWLCNIILTLFVILCSKNSPLGCLFSSMQLTRRSLILFLEDNMMTLSWVSIEKTFKEIELCGKGRFLSSNAGPLYGEIGPHRHPGLRECRFGVVSVRWSLNFWV